MSELATNPLKQMRIEHENTSGFQGNLHQG
jgi:hypothetical protein